MQHQQDDRTTEYGMRLASDEDAPYVFATWARSYKDSAHARSVCRSSEHYMTWMDRRMRRLVDRSLVIVAYDLQHQNLILGWACGEGSSRGLVMHFVYVRNGERGDHGAMAKALVAELAHRMGIEGVGTEPRYTHRRAPYTRRMEEHGWTFAPHLVSGKGEST